MNVGHASWRAGIVLILAFIIWNLKGSIFQRNSMSKPVSMGVRQPALFVGHGNPMMALRDQDPCVLSWKQFAKKNPRPNAILAISAHWFVGESCVTAQEKPRTIHDFGGFPKALFDVQYPAPGSPELAEKVAQLVAEIKGSRPRLDNDSWGLDHGTWTVLKHMYPEADIPVIQLSLDARQSDAYHYKVGRVLSKLRDEGVLILGSGNLVHNFAYISNSPIPPVWAAEFVDWIKGVTLDPKVDRDDVNNHPVVNWQRHKHGDKAQMGPDHFLPSLYVLGAAAQNENITWHTESWDMGSLSMHSILVGGVP